MKNIEDHEMLREEFWCKLVEVYGASHNAVDFKVVVNWADAGLAAFDERFGPEAHLDRAPELDERKQGMALTKQKQTEDKKAQQIKEAEKLKKKQTKKK